jgi:hypothetical protein
MPVWMGPAVRPARVQTVGMLGTGGQQQQLAAPQQPRKLVSQVLGGVEPDHREVGGAFGGWRDGQPGREPDGHGDAQRRSG